MRRVDEAYARLTQKHMVIENGQAVEGFLFRENDDES